MNDDGPVMGRRDNKCLIPFSLALEDSSGVTELLQFGATMTRSLKSTTPSPFASAGWLKKSIEVLAIKLFPVASVTLGARSIAR